MDDLGEFAWIDTLQSFIATFKFLKRLYHRLGHAAVGFFRTANEHELFTAGNTFVTVVIIETNTDQAG